jgi:hypothetical protein
MSGIYHEWNGTVLTVTSDSGTSSADLKGDDGCRGAQGACGEQYKPIRGVDYFTEEELTSLEVEVTKSCAPKDIRLDKKLEKAGWYKIGNFSADSQYCGSLKILVNGSYNFQSPYSALIEVVFGYKWANAKTIVPTWSGNGGTAKIAIKEDGVTFGIYIYYDVDARNNATFQIRSMGADFMPVDYELVEGFDEASALSVTSTFVSSFAPAGYGLGNNYRIISTPEELDAMRGSGFFVASVGVVDESSGWWGYHIEQNDGRFITQKVFTYNGSSKERTMWDGVWQPWEWVNPPMLPNVEYRTTERFNGKPVYKYYLHYGYWSQDVTTIPHGLGVVDSISIELMNSTQGLTNDIGVKHLTFNQSNIYIETDWAMGEAIFILKYTKG